MNGRSGINDKIHSREFFLQSGFYFGEQQAFCRKLNEMDPGMTLQGCLSHIIRIHGMAHKNIKCPFFLEPYLLPHLFVLY